MQIFTSRLLVSVTAFICCLLYSCGGGSTQVGGIDRSGAPVTSTSGPISGFGSVIVNGIRYHSDKANILVNDFSATESDLHAGFQVHISGTLNTDGTGEATTIEFFPNILGVISAIDTQASQLTVLGQTVLVTNSTLFSANISPNFIDGLKVGDKVQISGQVNLQGILIATRVDVITATSTLQLLGAITNLDTSNFTFSINNLTVNYASANLKNVTNNVLQNGAHVFITGGLNGNGVFTALTLKQLESTIRSGSDHAEVEGFITRFASTSDFDIAGVTCSTSSATTYEEGTSAALVVGASVEAIGSVNSLGRLIVNKIQFHQKDNQAIAGQVTAITINSNGAIVTGSLQVAGVTIQTNTLTRVEDNSSSELKRFNLSDIHVNDFLKIAGYKTSTGFIATQIERQDLQTNNSLRIEGVITAAEPSTFTFNINDRSVVVSNTAELHDATGATRTLVDFFALTLVGQNAEVRGILNNGVFTATEVEISN